MTAFLNITILRASKRNSGTSWPVKPFINALHSNMIPTSFLNFRVQSISTRSQLRHFFTVFLRTNVQPPSRSSIVPVNFIIVIIVNMKKPVVTAGFIIGFW